MAWSLRVQAREDNMRSTNQARLRIVRPGPGRVDTARARISKVSPEIVSRKVEGGNFGVHIIRACDSIGDRLENVFEHQA